MMTGGLIGGHPNLPHTGRSCSSVPAAFVPNIEDCGITAHCHVRHPQRGMLSDHSVLVIDERLPEFFSRVHHEGAAADDGLVVRLRSQKEEPGTD
jgi:hypothetical protein